MKSKRYRAWLLGRMAVILCLLAFLTSIAVLVVVPIISAADTGDKTEETAAATIYSAEPKAAVTEPSTAPWHKETAAYTYFDCELSEELQKYIFDLCKEKQIDPAIIVAMCWRESTYNPGAIGDGGNSYGLMQVQPKWHYDRMQRLGCTDLLDPYQNITVGVDYLCELLNRYGDMAKALTAYNRGHYAGMVTEYTKTVIAKAESLGVKE